MLNNRGKGDQRMNEKVSPFIIYYYDCEVVKMIMEKYGFDYFRASRSFISSQTHEMLEDHECAMWEFGYPALFDMWEVEMITGDPRNSTYIRGE